MRCAFLTAFILVALAAFGFRAHWHGVASHDQRTSRAARVQVIKKHQDPSVTEGNYPSWEIVGGWKETYEDAEQDALQKARDKVIEYLRGYGMGMHMAWVPSRDYVDNHLVKSRHKESKDFGKEYDAKDVGIMFSVHLNVEIPPRDMADMLQNDRHARIEERMLWLGKVLGGIVAALAAIAGAVTIDERTKGFYTGWLKLGVIGFIALVGASLYLVS